MLSQEDRIKKAHIMMMKHPETAFYSGVMMMGTTEVIDSKVTAYTNGVDKRYGRTFLETVCKDQATVNGLVLHENLHIALRHLIHNRDLFEEDRSLANMAADFVVNDIITNLKDQTLAKLPEGGCYDPKYHNMNMREVYRLLKQEQEESSGGEGEGSEKPDADGDANGNGGSGGGEYQFDEHGYDDGPDGQPIDAEKAKAIDAAVDRALREGALLAGRLGIDLPRAVTEILDPVVDWRRELADFVTASCRGNDEYTWRKFNRRQIANDIYLPTVEDETIGEVVVPIDTSGSIGQQQLNEFASELVSIAEAVQPERIRILWWDTKVHGEQIFEPAEFQQIGSLLKPKGGGGTRVSCVAEYINKKQIKADAVVVFTDGHVESDVQWGISSPTLWLVTENKEWVVPAGKKVMVV